MSFAKTALGTVAGGVLGLTLAFGGAVAVDMHNTQLAEGAQQAMTALQTSASQADFEAKIKATSYGSEFVSTAKNQQLGILGLTLAGGLLGGLAAGRKKAPSPT